MSIPKVSHVEAFVLSKWLSLALLDDFHFILWDEVDRTLDEPFLASFVVLLSAAIRVWDFSTNKEGFLLDDDDDIFNAFNQFLLGLQEEFGFTSSNFLFTKLGLTGFLTDRILDYTELVLSENDDTFLLDKLLVCVDNVDIFDSLINQPFFACSALLPVEILEVLQSTDVKSCEVRQDVSFPVLDDLDLSGRHVVTGLPMEPLYDR